MEDKKHQLVKTLEKGLASLSKDEGNIIYRALLRGREEIRREKEINDIIQQIDGLYKELGSIVLQKGDKGDVGERGIAGIDGKDGVDGIDGVNGIDGKDGLDGLNGKDGIAGKDGMNGVDGRDGINAEIDEDSLLKSLLKTLKKKKLLDVSYIQGLEGFSKDGINYRFEELMHGGGSSSSSVITYSVDLSSQCNGSNKVFTVPANTNFVLLTGTDAPLIYRPIVDYTGTGTTTLTIDALVNAPSSGATLILTYIV